MKALSLLLLALGMMHCDLGADEYPDFGPKELRVIKVENPSGVIHTSAGDISGCAHTIFRNPRSRFAAMIWCNDAQGTVLNILDVGRKNPGDIFPAWMNAEPIWIDGAFSGDSSAISWSENGRELMSVTHCIYGEGKIVLLDLPGRKCRVLKAYCPGNYDSAELESVDWKHRRAKIKLSGDSASKTQTLNF